MPKKKSITPAGGGEAEIQVGQAVSGTRAGAEFNGVVSRLNADGTFSVRLQEGGAAGFLHGVTLQELKD